MGKNEMSMNCLKLILITAFLVGGSVITAQATHYDIFLMAGQSNMDGRGAVKDLKDDLAQYAKPNTNILINFSAGGLKRPLTISQGLKPLQPGYSGTPGNKNPNALPAKTFGPEVSFGPSIAESLPGKHVLVIKFAEGGTSLGQDWNPNKKGKLYDKFIKFVRGTQEVIKGNGDTCTIRGMLWHQGESDAGMPAGKYQLALTELIARVRNDLGFKDLPFVIGQVYDNGKRTGIINDQKATAKAVAYTGFVDAVGLKTFDNGTHFNAKSQIELGKRFAFEMVRLLKRSRRGYVE